MSRSPSKVGSRKTKQRSAEIVALEVVETLRDLRLAEKALPGDVPSLIQWLSTFGGPEWKLPAGMYDELFPEGYFRHDPGRGKAG
jgi:hypothetical protein